MGTTTPNTVVQTQPINNSQIIDTHTSSLNRQKKNKCMDRHAYTMHNYSYSYTRHTACMRYACASSSIRWDNVNLLLLVTLDCFDHYWYLY